MNDFINKLINKMIVNNVPQATEAKQQRDEALNHVQLLTDKLEQISGGQNGSIIPKDLRGLSIQKLKTLQVRWIAQFC